MVAPMPFDKMEEISGKLAEVVAAYMKEKRLKAGKDIFFLISSDGNHYGQDFNNSPFGEGEKAWETALDLDRRLIGDYLEGGLDGAENPGPDQGALGRDVPRLPEHLLVRQVFGPVRAARGREDRAAGRGQGADRPALPLFRHLQRGRPPLKKTGMGTTAPFSLAALGELLLDRLLSRMILSIMDVLERPLR